MGWQPDRNTLIQETNKNSVTQKINEITCTPENRKSSPTFSTLSMPTTITWTLQPVTRKSCPATPTLTHPHLTRAMPGAVRLWAAGWVHTQDGADLSLAVVRAVGAEDTMPREV